MALSRGEGKLKKAILDLERMKAITLFLQESFEHGEPVDIEIAKTELEDLVDKFAEVFGDQVAPQQLETARRDPEYFLRLIDLARATLIKK